ncbi:hypothetical protein J6590_101159 [Homalodisca vitripennis]|nr:hypothetical protein J6590_101159 [Homalodisca vitripennis]
MNTYRLGTTLANTTVTIKHQCKHTSRADTSTAIQRSQNGGNTRARAVLLTAPTSEMNTYRLGTTSAITTVTMKHQCKSTSRADTSTAIQRSQSEGNMRARAVLITAPTSEMNTDRR